MVFFILLNYGDFLLTKIGCFRLTLFGDFLLTLTPSIWCLFATGFVLFMTFKKEKSDFMKKLDEKSRSIIFILTLVLGNDYIFFLSVKMSQANGILDPLEPLELLISYIIIIITAIASLVMIYKILKE